MRKIIVMVTMLLCFLPGQAENKGRRYAPSVKAKRISNNKKLQRKLQGQYTFISGGEASTLDIQEVLCIGKTCMFEFELRYGGMVTQSHVGFALGKRIFFTEWFINGHALMTAEVKKRETPLTVIAYFDGDCIAEYPYSVCDHSIGGTYMDTGRFFKRN